MMDSPHLVGDVTIAQGKLRVLLVDDDPEDQELTAELLHEMEGWDPHVRVASTYEEGLEAARTDSFHAMLVDYRLGARSGVDFLREPVVVASGAPVILLTGQGAREVDVEAARAGAADYLLKDGLDAPTLERALRYAIEVRRRHRVEARFRALIENSRDLISVIRADGSVAYISPSVERILGFRQDERVDLGAPWGVHPDDQDEARRVFAALLEEPSSSQRIVTRVAHKDGTWRVLDTMLQNRLEDPLIQGIVANSWDITELHDAEARLRERIKELRALYDIHRILLEGGADWGEIALAMARRVPAGFQHPDRVAARVRVGEAEGRSDGYRTGGPSLHQPILVDGMPLGEVEVVFVEDPPATGPAFLPEEGELLETVADRVAESMARRRAEREVARSEAFYRAIAERGGSGLVVLDGDGVVRHASDGVAAGLGRSPADLEGVDLGTLFEDSDHDRVRGDLAAAVASPGTLQEGRARMAAAGDEPGPIVDYTLRSLLREPPVHGVVLTLRDVTERVGQEERIRFQAELLDAVGQAVIATDARGRVTYWNRAAEALYGWSADEALGRDILALTPGESETEQAEAIMERLMRGEPWSGEFRVRHRDGTTFPVFITNAPILDEDGALKGIIGVSSDLRERKSLEEQLRQAQKMEAIGRLAGGVAHDFNNLLTAIQGHAELVMGAVPAGSALYTDALEIHRAGQRAASLTRQLLTFSRKQVLAEKVLDLGAVLREMDPMLRRLLPATVEVKSCVASEACLVRADAGQMQQILLNLALNAGDAMEQGGVLDMTVATVELKDEEAKAIDLESGAYVRLTVRDSGTGMTPDVLPHIFEPFFTTKPEGRGTGLGLATVFGIVEHAGGDVQVESAPGQGTTFHILLPRVEGEVAEETGGVAGTTAAAERPGETILLVEDDPAVRGLVKRILSRKGYRILEATNGYEALRQAEEHAGEIHLVVSDLVMPEMGGAELVARLRKLYPELRVILTSGYSEQALEGSVLDQGTAFLGKPFAPNELTSLVRQCLDEGG